MNGVTVTVIMATEGSFGQIGFPSYELPMAPYSKAGSGLLDILGSWALARVSDGGREATFSVGADERFAPVRRVHGGTASMLEVRLPSPMSAGDVVQALARWASSQSMTARLLPDAGNAARVTLSLPTD